MMKKKIYRIHKWLGLTLGGVLFLLALSGTCITFTHELMPKLYSSYFEVRPEASTLPLKELVQKARDYLGPERNITNLYAAEDPDEAHMILFKEPGKLLPSLITMNPYSGQVIGEMPLIKNIFAVMLFVHANLLLGKTGSYLVGLMGLVLLFFIISGIYVWWPKHEVWERFKRSMKFKGGRLPQKLHHFMGLVLALPLLISAVTGYLTIYDHSHSIGHRLKGEPPRVEELERTGTCSWEDQVKTLGLITPVMMKNLISIHFCTQKNSLMKVSYGLRDHDFLNGYGRLVIDPKTQHILQEFNSDTDPKSWNYKRLTIYPIHTGEYLGVFGRVIVLLGGLGLMGLFISGVILSLRRRARREQAAQFPSSVESL